jgi:hypothetical protein
MSPRSLERASMSSVRPCVSQIEKIAVFNQSQIKTMAEGVGFEPTRERNPLPVFKTGALNHSAILPESNRNSCLPPEPEKIHRRRTATLDVKPGQDHPDPVPARRHHLRGCRTDSRRRRAGDGRRAWPNRLDMGIASSADRWPGWLAPISKKGRPRSLVNPNGTGASGDR